MHATVVAYVALFMAMSGTAYATVEWTGANIQDGSLTGADVADNSLTGSDIESGTISSTDLAPGTLDTSGGSSTGNLLGQASNPNTVAGPLWADSQKTQDVLSLPFSVPAGHSYQVQLNVQSVVTVSYTACQWQTSFWGGGLALVADGDLSRNLVGYATSYLPGGATGTSQVAVFGPGDHTITLVNATNACGGSSFTDPGSVSMANSFLSANLLADF